MSTKKTKKLLHHDAPWPEPKPEQRDTRPKAKSKTSAKKATGSDLPAPMRPEAPKARQLRLVVGLPECDVRFVSEESSSDVDLKSTILSALEGFNLPARIEGEIANQGIAGLQIDVEFYNLRPSMLQELQDACREAFRAVAEHGNAQSVTLKRDPLFSKLSRDLKKTLKKQFKPGRVRAELLTKAQMAAFTDMPPTTADRDQTRKENLPSPSKVWESAIGGSGKQLTFAEQFRRAQLAEKISLLEGESPQTLNAVAIKAINELQSLDKVVNAICTQLLERGQSLTHAQFAALLEAATPRLQQAIRAQLTPAEKNPEVPVKQVRSLKDLESLRHKFFQAVVFGDVEPSLKRFEGWLQRMAVERFPDFESKQTAAQAAVYWQSVLADGLLRLDGRECLFTATKGERGSGVFRARFRKTREASGVSGKSQGKQEYAGVSFPPLTTS